MNKEEVKRQKANETTTTSGQEAKIGDLFPAEAGQNGRVKGRIAPPLGSSWHIQFICHHQCMGPLGPGRKQNWGEMGQGTLHGHTCWPQTGSPHKMLATCIHHAFSTGKIMQLTLGLFYQNSPCGLPVCAFWGV